jgi:hypothetical protein
LANNAGAITSSRLKNQAFSGAASALLNDSVDALDAKSLLNAALDTYGERILINKFVAKSPRPRM